MIQKVKNVVDIRCDDVDFLTAENMEVYVSQGAQKFSYELIAVESHLAQFCIPKADAMKLCPGTARLQFAVTVDGEAIVSNINSVSVDELLWGDGYGY